MKNLGIPILVAILVLLMGLMLVTFQVRETELAFVARFGNPVRYQNEPGLYFKWPTPIEKAHKSFSIVQSHCHLSIVSNGEHDGRRYAVPSMFWLASVARLPFGVKGISLRLSL